MADDEAALSRLKVVELQKELRDLGLSGKGSKADLIQRLAEARKKQKAALGAGSSVAPVTMKPLPITTAAAPPPAVAPPPEGTDGSGGQSLSSPAVESLSSPAGEDKGKVRVISVRGSGGGSPAAAPEAKKTMVESRGAVGAVGAVTSDAVTSDSIQALIDKVETSEPDKPVDKPQDTPQDPDSKKSRITSRAERFGLPAEPAVVERPTMPKLGDKRMRPDGLGGASRPNSSSGNQRVVADCNHIARTDGVRGRGVNKFAAVAEESKREEPPDQRPEKVLKMEGLRRPFTDKQLKDHLSEYGVVTWFWLNRIKSICFVEFQNEDEASKARSETYDVQWPLNTGGRVKSSFCTREDADAFVEKEPSAKPLGARLGVFPPGREAPSRMAMDAEEEPASKRPRWNERERLPERDRMEAPLRKEAKEPKRLEDLFNKTKAKPEIYWCANSPDAVKARLERMRA